MPSEEHISMCNPSESNPCTQQPVTPPILCYQSNPRRWQVWLARAYKALMVVIANIVAGMTAYVLLAILPVVVTWIIFIVYNYFLRQILDNKPLPIGFPLLISGTLHSVGIFVVTLLIPLMLCVDLIRRLIRRGWWLVLAAAPIVIPALVALWALNGATKDNTLQVTAIVSPFLFLFFCAYWLPLGFVDLLRWCTEKLTLKLWHTWHAHHQKLPDHRLDVAFTSCPVPPSASPTKPS